MDKKFFMVVPFMPPPKIQPSGGFFSPKPVQTVQINVNEFNNYKTELKQRVEVIESGLSSIGVRTAILNTQQTIELLYGIYNPEEANREKLVEQNTLNGNMVESVISQPAPQTPEGGTP
jgi:hypothetical protein